MKSNRNVPVKHIDQKNDKVRVEIADLSKVEDQDEEIMYTSSQWDVVVDHFIKFDFASVDRFAMGDR